MLKWALIILLSSIILFPLLYTISLSFFSYTDFTDVNARFLPSSVTFRNYTMALSNSLFTRYVFNSLIVSFLLAFLRLSLTIVAAFAFSHFSFKGKSFFLVFLLSTLFVPPEALLFENYQTIVKMGLLNTYIAIILPSVFSASSLIFLLGSFKTTEKDLYQISQLDGASDLKYLLKILIPVNLPVIITVFLQAFVTTFNNYLWPLIVTTKTQMRTIQVGFSMLGFAESGEKGAEAATIVLVVIPLLFVLAASKKAMNKILNGDIFNS